MERKNRLSIGLLWTVALFSASVSIGCYSSSTTSIGAAAESDSGTDNGSHSKPNVDSVREAEETGGDDNLEQVTPTDGGSDNPTPPPTIRLPTDGLDAGSPDANQGFVFPVLPPSTPDTDVAPPISPPTEPEYDAGEVEFSGGLEPGERAPAPGEVSGNVYGGPTVPFGPYTAGFPSECDNTGGMAMMSPEGGNQCIAYNLCSIACVEDSDCDDGGSGNSIPTCRPSLFSGNCELICDENTTCPDGMVCIDDVERNMCMWPADIAQPGCPAWCELDPLPKDCPGWCAVAGVGCDPDVPDYCCEGLVCGSEGWCVEESA